MVTQTGIAGSRLHVQTYPWYAEFTRSISDASDVGEAISNQELNKILATLNSNYIRQKPTVTHLLERWNATIARGRRRPSGSEGQLEAAGNPQNENVISLATLHELILLTNVLNALASSQVAERLSTDSEKGLRQGFRS